MPFVDIALGIGMVVLMTVLTCTGLWGIKRAYDPETWMNSRNTQRRKRIMGAIWFVYLMILCPALAVGLNLLQVLESSVILFIGLWGGVLTTGLLACRWFAEPSLWRGWTALVSIALVTCLIWLTAAMR